MQKKYELDNIDGCLVPPLVVTFDHVINGTHQGTVHVEAGTLELRGVLQGTLVIHSNAEAIILGTQQGTLSLAKGAACTVHGAIQGSTSIDRGATLLIEATGKLAGTLTNNGTFVLRGVFGGAHSGVGNMQVEDNGCIKQPAIRDGIHFYDW